MSLKYYVEICNGTIVNIR